MASNGSDQRKPQTRLDRLLNLLGNGQTSSVRLTAASQIGAVAGSRIQHSRGTLKPHSEHPHDHNEVYRGIEGDWPEVAHLLRKLLLPLLSSKSNESRLAAAQAVEAVSSSVGIWDPSHVPVVQGHNDRQQGRSDRLRVLHAFDLKELLASQPTLLGSSGSEFAHQQASSKGSASEAAQKDVLNKLVGSHAGVNETDLGLDLKSELHHNGDTASSTSASPAPMEADPPQDLSKLSARERNTLKRKRKLGGGAQPAPVASKMPKVSHSPSPASSPDKKSASLPPPPPPPVQSSQGDVKVKSEFAEGEEEQPVQGPLVISHHQPSAAKVEPTEDEDLPDPFDDFPPHLWPFTSIVTRLSDELLNPTWTVRHGAALGLQALLRHQGAHGGKEAGQAEEENDALHESWTAELACKLLELLARDRFGDYVGDTVLAPVRECASNALATLLELMSDDGRERVRAILVQMVKQEDMGVGGPGKKGHIWQVRHSGLLGLQFLVESTVARELPFGDAALAELGDVCLVGLSSSDDDVRAAAAAMIRPIVKTLIRSNPSVTEALVSTVWHCLEDRADDLSSSVSNIMALCTDLLADPGVIRDLLQQPPGRHLKDLPALLLPYFRHTITEVRSAVLTTLNYLFKMTFSSEGDSQTVSLENRDVLRLLFQNLLIEGTHDVVDLSQQTFHSLIHHMQSRSPASVQALKNLVISWYGLASVGPGSTLDPSSFFTPTNVSRNHLDVPAMRMDLSLVNEDQIIGGRLESARALGLVASMWPAGAEVQAFHDLIKESQSSESWFTRSYGGYLTSEWTKALQAREHTMDSSSKDSLSALFSSLMSATAPPQYTELGRHFTILERECEQLLQEAKGYKIPAKRLPSLRKPLTLDGAKELASGVVDAAPQRLDESKLSALKDRKERVLNVISNCRSSKDIFDVRVEASRGGAVVALDCVPQKLNPLIRGLMNSLKFEAMTLLQNQAATALAHFILMCSDPKAQHRINPSEKIVKNLCAFLCQDTQVTPVFNDQKDSERAFWASFPELEEEVLNGTPPDAAETGPAQIVAKGAEGTLGILSRILGDHLLQQLPKLDSCMHDGLRDSYTGTGAAAGDGHLRQSQHGGQDAIDAMTVLAAVAQLVHPSLHPNIAESFGPLSKAICSSYAVIRSTASKCMARLCVAVPVEGLSFVVKHLLPSMTNPKDLDARRGVAELVSNLVARLDTSLLPFITFFLVPVLSRTTDSDPPIRSVATLTFAKLVRLVPLESGYPDPENFPEDLKAKRAEERQFLAQLLDGSKAEQYEIPVTINAELRRYQREGISWLAFLAKYRLHGILCDDMGLGKTLQTICILASVTHDRAEKYAKTQDPEFMHMPSLVICPTTLTHHWAAEIEQYAPSLRVQALTGDKTWRNHLLAKKRSNTDVFVISYENARNDVSDLAPVQWTYCILDEGHVIKNPKTKLAQAVKRMKANHRLILSGTPVQNHVLELWNLFDFLMPGFLGTERAFNERFSKPIKASRDSKTSSKEQAAANLALESLHRQVLPFVMRRLKEDVLDDLPPKIIQDYYCDLSPLQQSLYERSAQDEADDEGEGEAQSPHVFQTLQYMRKLVNHPLLVLQPGSSEHQELVRDVKSEADVKNLHNIEHAPKLAALRQILGDCGIGIKAETESLADEAVAPHRVLVFCQMRQMLDIIEEDLFRPYLPDVTYMRMDGSVAPNKRHSIVKTFNADPSIDVLLLTTSVGGLGLTLTGADTVIFVEHDWNPMKDVQAMDRAHRLGQKRVVNVYRLITRATLEEKIMGLQKFKMNIASSVVNEQNSNLGAMETDQVLDLFDAPAAAPNKGSKKKSGKKMSRQALLAGVGELEELS